MDSARTPPEHRARTRRWGHGERRRRSRRRDARWERAAAGDSDVAAEVPAVSMAMVLASSSSPVKKPRILLSSQIGEVFGSLCRVESVDAEDAEDATPDFAGVAEAVATPSWTPVASHADGDGGGGMLTPEAAAAQAHGGADNGVTAPTSSSPAPAPTANGLFVASMTLLQTPPPPSSTPVAAASTTSGVSSPPPPLAAAPFVTPEKRAAVIPAMPLSPPSAARRAAAPFLRLPPPQLQPVDDAFERTDRLKRRFSSIIAKSQQAIDERYREDLRNGRVVLPEPEPAPAPEPEPVVDEETLRRLAVIEADRRRFRVGLQRTEVKAKQDALFMQSARPAHLRALGIDAAMERVVSPARPRGGDGSPIVSPAHARSPVEKLGFFLKSP